MFQNDRNRLYSGRDDLESAELTLENYNTNIAKLIYKKYFQYKHSAPVGVLDFGAGTGFLTKKVQKYFGIEVVCVEIDPLLVIGLKNSFQVIENLNELENHVDLVFSSNVLEHIEDDISKLREIFDILCSDGLFITYLPARMKLFSDLDKKVGHFRRYEILELRSKLLQTGFEVLEIRNVDSLGYLASKALQIFGYKMRLGLGSRKSLSLYDKVVFPISALIDKLFFGKIPGKNILCVARKSLEL